MDFMVEAPRCGSNFSLRYARNLTRFTDFFFCWVWFVLNIACALNSPVATSAGKSSMCSLLPMDTRRHGLLNHPCGPGFMIYSSVLRWLLFRCLFVLPMKAVTG